MDGIASMLLLIRYAAQLCSIPVGTDIASKGVMHFRMGLQQHEGCSSVPGRLPCGAGR